LVALGKSISVTGIWAPDTFVTQATRLAEPAPLTRCGKTAMALTRGILVAVHLL
jgi:hypothetical protein